MVRDIEHSSGEFAAARVALAGAASRDIPELVSRVYGQSPLAVRAQLLECLLRPVGPLALVAIAAGAFGHLLYRLGRNAVPVSVEDAARVSSGHVLQLARYIEQSSPDALAQIGALLDSSRMGMASLSGSALLLALGAWRLRSGPAQDAAPPRQATARTS